MVRKRNGIPARNHSLDSRLRDKNITDRLDALAYRYDYTYELVKYIRDNQDLDPDKLRRIAECYNYAVGGIFDDRSIGTRILHSNACKQHRLCANCAHLRSVRNALNLAETVACLLSSHKDVKPIFTTLTILNGIDIRERYNHLMRSFKRLQKIRLNAIEGHRSSLRSQVIGGLFSAEIKMTKKQLWHPHLHGLELVPIDFNVRHYDTELENHWYRITGDSKITRVLDVKMDSEESLIKSCMEITKYSMKQASMTPAKQWEAYQATCNKQLVRRFGVFRGFTFDEDYNIERLRKDLSASPYREFFLKRESTIKGTTFRSIMGEKKSGYSPGDYRDTDIELEVQRLDLDANKQVGLTDYENEIGDWYANERKRLRSQDK